MQTKDSFRQATDTVSNKIDETKVKARAGLRTAADEAESLFDRAAEGVQHTYEDLKDKSVELQEDVVELIKANPVKSVAIALVVGILGTLLAKRND